jgi:pimeloyl-ACP methyl ester carboxylesterase
MPETGCWNGSVVVFAHGYVAPGPSIGVPTDQLSIGGVSLPATFNQLGYGFAASSYSKNGLAIVEGVKDTMDLVQNIIKPQLKPSRVYLIGASEGGLVTALSAEQLPHVYNAAGAACGPIGSFQRQIDYFGDFRVVFDYFFPGVIPGSPVNIPQKVQTNWLTVYVQQIEAALAANPGAAAQLINVTGASVTSDPTTVGETVIGLLWYNVFATNDAGTTLGGQPFDNHNRIYLGSSNDLLLNMKVARFTASPKALAAVAAHYETSGKLNMPMVTLHTTGDPIIPYWQEPLYTLKTLAAGAFFERTPLPVAAYGHCAFTAGDVLTAFDIMVLRATGLHLDGVE